MSDYGQMMESCRELETENAVLKEKVEELTPAASEAGLLRMRVDMLTRENAALKEKVAAASQPVGMRSVLEPAPAEAAPQPADAPAT